MLFNINPDRGHKTSQFFIIYVSDLPNISSLTQSLLFANETSILCSHRDHNHLISQYINNELAKGRESSKWIAIFKKITIFFIWLKANN